MKEWGFRLVVSICSRKAGEMKISCPAAAESRDFISIVCEVQVVANLKISVYLLCPLRTFEFDPINFRRSKYRRFLDSAETADICITLTVAQWLYRRRSENITWHVYIGFPHKNIIKTEFTTCKEDLDEVEAVNFHNVECEAHVDVGVDFENVSGSVEKALAWQGISSTGPSVSWLVSLLTTETDANHVSWENPSHFFR